MSDDTDDDVPSGPPSSRRKSKKRLLSSDSSSSCSNSSPVLTIKRKANYRIVSEDSDSENDSSGSSIVDMKKRKKVARISSDSDEDSDSSDSVVIRRVKRSANIIESENEENDFKNSSSQWETDVSDNENEADKKIAVPSSSKKDEKDIDSDSSDGQSEKCPICLLPIRNQELGSPESCDHLFCVDCITEWSKNMNTCPVDRQEYHLILVRKKLNGKIIRQIPVEKPVTPQSPQEDQTFCEICGSGDREDRLLLCDGCDLGFHLECLTPPLQEVPFGSWYCNECDPNETVERELDFMEIHLLLEDQELAVMRNFRGSRSNTTRLIPRTRQTERVRSRIMTNRSIRDEVEEPSSSTHVSRSNVATKKRTRKPKKKSTRKKSSRKSKPRYRTVYEVDEDTGEVISKKKQVKGKKGRKAARKRPRGHIARPPKTVKKRLAQQLGICPKKTPAQTIPDVKAQNSGFGINTQRYQAGIPTLHLFGQRDDIDYFSASDDDISGGDYLVRRRPNHSDVSLFRRVSRRKGAVVSSSSAVSSTSDILGSILDSQSKLYSKNTKFSVDNSGKFKMENEKRNSNNNVNLKDFNNLAKQTPYGGNNRNSNGRRNDNRNSYSNNSYQGNNSYYNYDNYGPSSTSENYMSFGNQGAPGNYDQDMPQDYTQSTLSSYDRDIDFDNPRRNEENQQEDSDIDIYSDIEDSVSTSKVEEEEAPPLRSNYPPPVLNPNVPTASNGSDVENDNNDSDNDMVIDTEKVEPVSQEEPKEDSAVTSSADSVVKCNSSSDVASVPHSTTGTGTTSAQSVFDKGKDDVDDEEDAFSEDGCPNFSIYSTESINLAKNTDVNLNAEDKPEDNNQVVSSTPVEAPSQQVEADMYNPQDVYDPESAYDPEAAYNSERESEAPEPSSEAEDAYDPERVYDTPEDTYDPEKAGELDEESKEGSGESKDENTSKITEEDDDTLKTSMEATENDDVAPADDTPCKKSVENDEEKSLEDNKEKSFEDDKGKSFEDDKEKSFVDDGKKPVIPSKQVVVHSVEVVKSKNLNVLYSDSEDEEVVKISKNTFIGDISTMTEDVSEEERSYTPCLDEKASSEKGRGLDGLDTEMISDDEKNNDFDESHEHKTASEGDALEINAKESEMEMIRPEDYEEGEIVDKNKAHKDTQNEESSKTETDKENPEKASAETEHSKPSNENKENEPKDKQSFKKLSKNNKERNYRDKDRSKSRDRKEKDKDKNKEITKSKKKDKRKEIERYDVRALIAEKPRRLKDKFGRDVRKSSSKSISRSRSKSYTPKRSPNRRSSPRRRVSSQSRERKRKKRSGSSRRSLSKSRSRSRQEKRSVSRTRRRRSRSRSKRKRKGSKDRSKRRKRARSSSRTYTPTRKRRQDWEDRYSRERDYSADGRWTPSLSRTPEVEPRHASPSWTPPRTMESAAVDPRNLTVILQNDQNKKKKDRKKKGAKKKETDRRNKRRRKDRTPPPSKEVFASGDNILVSVSFNKENETRERDVFTKKKKEADDREKRKKALRRKKKNQELSGIKPVAIIDLDRSPFRELTPSPKDIIVLSDEEHVENSNINDSQDICDSSQQVASPENVQVYMTGPKTPPEPQIKFTLPSKQQPLRPLLSNPLHDPEDDMQDDQEAEEVHDLSDTHKGPNTPPDPPNSPPSSPDAYDPFEPTKSRSPSPDPAEVSIVEDSGQRNGMGEHAEKITSVPSSLTPPIADVQPADSQSSIQISRDSSKSPEQIGRSVQQSIKSSAPLTTFPAAVTITSTPLQSNGGQGRINILNSTILSNVSSTIPQRIVLPNVKLSPVKVSPVKNVIKSTPIKPMPNKNSSNTNISKSKSKSAQQNGNESSEVIGLDFDSPYSPGSSDYEDLFEPPPEVVTKKTLSKSAPTVGKETQSSKVKNTFDTLFGTPMKKINMDKNKSKKSRGTKIVGVKLDEDHLKILDELPNSAVEMQVKDKFLKKLNRQERVVEEVKLVLKPYYNKKKIDKEEYKDIMRRAVPKICHNKSGEINPTRIKNLIEAYVRKMRHAKPKVTSSSSYNPMKV